VKEPFTRAGCLTGEMVRGFEMHAIIYLVGLVVIVLAIVNLVA
jgi:hypothetical protein